MKGKWIAAAAAAAVVMVSSALPVQAADRWDMAYIGRMKPPAHVTFQEGEQTALPFLSTGGIRWTFVRGGMMDGRFYTMTYADGTDFSYGWAASAVVGVPYLVKHGETAYRNKTPAEQMDVIAGLLNREIREKGASYDGQEPLKRLNDKGHPRWEGSFVTTRQENGITYREKYQMVLQVSGFRVVLGVICSDADRTQLGSGLARMMQKRSFYKEKDLLEAFLHGK